ncbi:MAG TPA: YraN family protein [Gammaproteobacteria bacterium]|nr:YraN family protein [Gammaproteobacteria bacterium]
MGADSEWGSASAALKDRQAIGKLAEEEACAFLQKRGLRLITRNYRCRLGEIDLIMWDRSSIVFIEVRCRKPSVFGTAAETVTSLKQRKLIKAAMYYLQQQRISEQQVCRFDVVAMTTSRRGMQISWIKDAFQASGAFY